MADEQQPAAPEQDISSKTILLLVVLTLTVSFIGAWVNINSAMSAAPHQAPPQSAAQVSFEITQPPVPQRSAASGMVSLNIQQPGP